MVQTPLKENKMTEFFRLEGLQELRLLLRARPTFNSDQAAFTSWVLTTDSKDEDASLENESLRFFTYGHS